MAEVAANQEMTRRRFFATLHFARELHCEKPVRELLAATFYHGYTEGWTEKERQCAT